VTRRCPLCLATLHLLLDRIITTFILFVVREDVFDGEKGMEFSSRCFQAGDVQFRLILVRVDQTRYIPKDCRRVVMMYLCCSYLISANKGERNTVVSNVLHAVITNNFHSERREARTNTWTQGEGGCLY